MPSRARRIIVPLLLAGSIAQAAFGQSAAKDPVGAARELYASARYDEALAVLDLMQDRETAEALNYRGYATRKLGRVDEGIGYYLKSVALDPHYAQVREYLGEAYVSKGDVERAREQLRAIEAICGTGCEEYEDLAKAISEQKRS